MALSKPGDITPEEQLLRLIEKPAGIGEIPVESQDAIIVLGEKKVFSPKIIIERLFSFPLMVRERAKKISLKTVNNFCLVVITVLFGYAIWSVVAAETPVIDAPSVKTPNIVDMTQQPDINQYYEEINKRAIFIDMYKPSIIEAPRTDASGVTVVTAPAEAKPVMAEVMKNLKLIGVIWEPQSVTQGLALIDDGSEVRCLSQRETFRTKLEKSGNLKYVNIEIKEIFKDKVILSYEADEGELVLTD